MELEQFFEGIQMIPEAVVEVEELTVLESEYQVMRSLFQEDREAFYAAVLKESDYRIRFLYYFSRMACETYECYQDAEIESKIFWDTFYDLTLWCENCFKIYGEYGINQYDWFFRHIECRIFRLGRLEYEKMKSEWVCTDGQIQIKKGDDVISIHIPAGEKLKEQELEESYRQAYSFWGTEYPYVCHSWLLYPELSRVLKKESNILKFQKYYRIVRTDFEEQEAEERIFEIVQEKTEEYSENTSLQRNAKQYLLSGEKLGNGLGILSFPPQREIHVMNK